MRHLFVVALVLGVWGWSAAPASAAPEEGASPAPTTAAPATTAASPARTAAAPAPAAAAPTTVRPTRTVRPMPPGNYPDPRATRCRRDFGWYPHYRYRCAPRGGACRPVTWRAPYYRRVDYCPNWYGPACYGRPFPSRTPRSAYYRQVMGR